MATQKILTSNEDFKELDDYFTEISVKRILLVCGSSLKSLKINQYLNTLEERKGIHLIRFSDFNPNPVYESIVKGVALFREQNCDMVMAIGGGSAMDVAKCIKLYANMEPDINYLEQKIIPNNIPMLAMPTTAGTGSEATRYAVIYYHGEKQSVSDTSCIPDAVLMDASVLRTLPEYHKKATMMDAFCHALESFWSVNSTETSRDYSRQAISLILENSEGYLANRDIENAGMLKAANVAGKAINITQTTAGHAMCYKLTSLYGIAHGHAAALCTAKIWPYMLTHMEHCNDPRGQAYLEQIFQEIADAMRCQTAESAIKMFQDWLDKLELKAPVCKDEKEYAALSSSINTVRLKNNPVALSDSAISELYHQILTENERN